MTWFSINIFPQLSFPQLLSVEIFLINTRAFYNWNLFEKVNFRASQTKNYSTEKVTKIKRPRFVLDLSSFLCHCTIQLTKSRSKVRFAQIIRQGGLVQSRNKDPKKINLSASSTCWEIFLNWLKENFNSTSFVTYTRMRDTYEEIQRSFCT